MAEFPYLPLWTDAYLGDTLHLSTIQHGAYLLLLMVAWRSDGRLPADDDYLAKCTRMTKGQWYRHKHVLEAFFSIEGAVHKGVDKSFWVQKRLLEEWQDVRQKSKRQSDKANSRWLKEKEKRHTTASARDSFSIPIQNHTQNHSQNHSQDSNKSLPRITVHASRVEKGFAVEHCFKIEHSLTDEVRVKAKALCKALNRDFNNLCRIYDEAVNNGTLEKPRFPNAAFLVWIEKYTKGIRL